MFLSSVVLLLSPQRSSVQQAVILGTITATAELSLDLLLRPVQRSVKADSISISTSRIPSTAAAARTYPPEFKALAYHSGEPRHTRNTVLAICQGRNLTGGCLHATVWHGG